MLENIKIIRIDKTNRDTSENKEYLRQYYAVRAEAFEDNGYSGLYDGIETEYDADKNTIIFLALNENNVVRGGGINFSSPDDRKMLKFENYKGLEIKNLLPHIDTSKITYAELGGVAVDKSAAGLSIACKLEKEMYLDDKVRASDIAVCVITPQNVTIALRAAKCVGIQGVVRDDLKIARNGSPRTIFMFSHKPDFPLLSQEMKDVGVGIPSDEFLMNNVKKKRELAVC